MKTARSIEEQDERKAARDNQNQPQTSRELTQSVTRKSKRGDASRIAAWRWQPGRSANPGDVPKHDVAKEIAKAIFLNNPEMIYAAYCKILRRGNAYAFQVLADRAFGKLKESIAHELSQYRDPTNNSESVLRNSRKSLACRHPSRQCCRRPIPTPRQNPTEQKKTPPA